MEMIMLSESWQAAHVIIGKHSCYQHLTVNNIFQDFESFWLQYISYKAQQMYERS